GGVAIADGVLAELRGRVAGLVAACDGPRARRAVGGARRSDDPNIDSASAASPCWILMFNEPPCSSGPGADPLSCSAVPSKYPDTTCAGSPPRGSNSRARISAVRLTLEFPAVYESPGRNHVRSPPLFRRARPRRAFAALARNGAEHLA